MASEKKGSRGSGKNPRKGPPRVDIPDKDKRFIISSLEAGGTLESTVRAVGISPRTFRELRQRARGDHPTRFALPHLEPFFDDVHQAIGRRLLANEIWLSDHDPKYALRYLRSSLDADEDEEPLRLPTAEEMQQELDALISSGAFRVSQCQDENCPCDCHRGERRSS
jgi:hypothetical protein